MDSADALIEELRRQLGEKDAQIGLLKGARELDLQDHDEQLAAKDSEIQQLKEREREQAEQILRLCKVDEEDLEQLALRDEYIKAAEACLSGEGRRQFVYYTDCNCSVCEGFSAVRLELKEAGVIR